MDTDHTQNPSQIAEIVCLDCGSPYPIGAKYCPVCGAWPPIAAVLAAKKSAGIPPVEGMKASPTGTEDLPGAESQPTGTLLERRGPDTAAQSGLDEAPTVAIERPKAESAPDQAPTLILRRTPPVLPPTNESWLDELPSLAHPEGWLSENVLQRVISVLKIRNRHGEARTLVETVEREPSNSGAWFELAEEVRADIEKRACLQKVLEISPNHPAALEAWHKLPPTPWPREELPLPEPIPAAAAPAVATSEPQQMLRSGEPVPKSWKPPPTRTSNGWLGKILLAVLILALIISQAWQIYRITQLENALSTNQATLASFQKLVTELIVQVEQLKSTRR